MSYDGITPTKFGQYQVAETPSSLMRLHFHDGTTALKTVDHEPKVDVLDQEDLTVQGIDTSELVPGAQAVDALGSCTAQATTAAVSNLAAEAADAYYQALLAGTTVASFSDTTSWEKAAIVFYNRCSHQTGNPAQEWPPTDCGSSGLYCVEELEKLGVAKGDKLAHGATNIVSLLQTDGLIVGQPFLKAWMEPDNNGFIDGDGSVGHLMKQITGGLAGGHETYAAAVEKLVLYETGLVDPFKTIIRYRNSWSKSYGDHGSYRAHLSTYILLGHYVDMRQLVAR